MGDNRGRTHERSITMTKQDCLDEIKELMEEAKNANGNKFQLGQFVALEYCYDMVKRIKPYSVHKTAINVPVSLTLEQAKYLEGLLGNGALDRVIRGKITKGINNLWEEQG